MNAASLNIQSIVGLVPNFLPGLFLPRTRHSCRGDATFGIFRLPRRPRVAAPINAFRYDADRRENEAVVALKMEAALVNSDCAICSLPNEQIGLVTFRLPLLSLVIQRVLATLGSECGPVRSRPRVSSFPQKPSARVMTHRRRRHVSREICRTTPFFARRVLINGCHY